MAVDRVVEVRVRVMRKDDGGVTVEPALAGELLLFGGERLFLLEGVEQMVPLVRSLLGGVLRDAEVEARLDDVVGDLHVGAARVVRELELREGEDGSDDDGVEGGVGGVDG